MAGGLAAFRGRSIDMPRKKMNDNILVFVAIWLLIPLGLVLISKAFRLPELLARWVDGGN